MKGRLLKPSNLKESSTTHTMAAMAEQHYGRLFTQQQPRPDDFAPYPSPPSNTFVSTPPLDVGVAGEAGFAYSGTTTCLGFEPSLYAETTNYIINNHASPGAYAEDGDMRLSSSGLSSGSLPSAPSSVIGSPQSNNGQLGVSDWSNHTINVQPGIVGSDFMAGPEYYMHPGMEDFARFDFGGQPKSFIDPSLIHPEIARPPMPISPFNNHFQQHAQTHPFVPSPSLSSSPQPHMVRPDSASPFLHNGPFPSYVPNPYGIHMDPNGRRLSLANFISPGGTADFSGDETKEKQRCTYPDCGKVFKDLKAHMLTHQNERPEKCPIQNCEYHIKGFARKYDKNRHTLTHYKGTMVCGFCPGSGSPAEKSFNRADVFKRHLTAVHGVEQTPPNSRKKAPAGGAGAKKLTGYAPDATGKCSTCSQTFSNAQDFYEHLDDCVLRIVQQEDPAEAINAQRLAEVENDKVVHQTLEKNNLPTTTPVMQTTLEDDEDDLDMGEDDEVDDSQPTIASNSNKKKSNPANGVQKSRGVTHSRGGVPVAVKARGRKNRRDYPSSWGFDKGQMTMKKRIMAVFDGPRRLAKDDMMLSTDHEVRIKLSDGKSYVTDLDVQTLKRAEGFLGATDAEKGPWISDDPTEDQLKEMHEMLKTNSAAI